MGKTLQIKTFMAVGSVLFLALSIGVLFNQPARAFDAKATPVMLNRTAIAMGSADKAENIFYDKDTANDNYVWQNMSNGCYSDITRESVPANPEAGTGGGYKWVLRASTKLGDGSCSPEKTSTLSEPKNYDAREFVVFYRDNTDVINSVKADVTNPFINTNTSRGGAAAIYIEKDNMDPYDCPSLIIDQKSPDGWMYVMMRRANNDSDASKQYAALIRELAGKNFFPEGISSGDFTDDNAICEVVPADGDDEKESILAYYGLPGSYYNTRASDENREQVDLDYDGANLGGFDLHTMYGMDAAGMSLAGPLKGGFIESGELEAGGNEDSGDLGPTCSAGALGWVLCPLSEAIVSATESIAGILEELLTFQPLTTGEQGNAIRAIWGTLLGVANAGLVIAFLVIVFSQATSIGLSSYGIKKLLPRVIAAAILMNLSFYICAAAVDISNILGVSIKSIVDVGIEQVTASSNNPDLYTGAGGMQWIAVIVAATLAAAIAVATGAIFLLLPVLVAGLMAVFTALIIIAARQVLITLLIIVAPLAILAWILPNTEQWFTRWRKLFTLLLLMFPLVMAIFYGSVLVSNVILAASGNSGSGLNDFTIKLLAFLVLIVPLFSLPFVIKSVGGIMDRLGIIVNNRNKGVVDRSRKWAGDNKYRKYQQQRRDDRKAGIATGNYVGRGGLYNPRNVRSRANRALNDSRAFNQLSGGYGAQRDLVRQAQQRKDMQEVMAMFGQDDDLVKVWARHGNNRDTARTMLSATQLQQFDRLQQAGHNRKSTSYLAAAQYLSESGKGDGDMVYDALQNAGNLGATATDVSGAGESAVAAYRSSGRGDALARLRTNINTSGGTTAGTVMSAEEGWSQVAASTTHREALSTATGDPASYANYLNTGFGTKSGETATIEALRGFDRMEARAQSAALPAILSAASTHAGTTFANVQEAKTHYGITT